MRIAHVGAHALFISFILDLFHTEAFVSFVFDLASGTCMFLALL